MELLNVGMTLTFPNFVAGPELVGTQQVQLFTHMKSLICLVWNFRKYIIGSTLWSRF